MMGRDAEFFSGSDLSFIIGLGLDLDSLLFQKVEDYSIKLFLFGKIRNMVGSWNHDFLGSWHMPVDIVDFEDLGGNILVPDDKESWRVNI